MDGGWGGPLGRRYSCIGGRKRGGHFPVGPVFHFLAVPVTEAPHALKASLEERVAPLDQIGERSGHRLRSGVADSAAPIDSARPEIEVDAILDGQGFPAFAARHLRTRRGRQVAVFEHGDRGRVGEEELLIIRDTRLDS